MNFLPRDICEKLVEKGCQSESGFYYVKRSLLGYATDPTWVSLPAYGNPRLHGGYVDYVHSFIFQDFCGISEQAKKNCEILWPGRWNCNCPFYTDEKSKHCDTGVFIDEYNFTRERMLKMTEDEWVEFIRGAVDENIRIDKTS